MLSMIPLGRLTIPYLMLTVQGSAERLVFVDSQSVPRSLSLPNHDLNYAFDLSLLTSQGDVGVTTWGQRSYWWQARTGKLMLIQDRAHRVFLGMSSGKPLIAQPMGSPPRWCAAKWTGRLNEFLPVTQPDSQASMLSSTWGKGSPVGAFAAMTLYSPPVRDEWHWPWAETSLLRAEGSKLFIDGAKLYDFGNGARVQLLSGNSRYGTASAVYFENPKLTVRGGRNLWTDARSPGDRREVYRSVIVDLTLRKVVLEVDGAARLEVPRP